MRYRQTAAKKYGARGSGHRGYVPAHPPYRVYLVKDHKSEHV